MWRPATPAVMYCLTVRATLAGPPNLENIGGEINDGLLRGGYELPCVGVRNNGDRGVQTADHLSGTDEVVHRGDGKVRLAETRSRSGGTTVRYIRKKKRRNDQRANLWYMQSNPASRAQRALIPSQIPGATYHLGFRFCLMVSSGETRLTTIPGRASN